MSTEDPIADKSGDRAYVTDDEVEQWVAIIRDLFNRDEECDIGGGIAPATINAHADRERDLSTIRRHLSSDERVVVTRGIQINGKGGGPRLSYVPVGDGS